MEDRIAHTYEGLAESMAAPPQWESALKQEDTKWTNYFEGFRTSSQKFAEELERQLDLFNQLIKPDLLNDMTEILFLLTCPLAETIRSTSANERNTMLLFETASLSSSILGKIVASIERNKLSKRLNPTIAKWSDGEPRLFKGSTGRGSNIVQMINTTFLDAKRFTVATQQLLDS